MFKKLILTILTVMVTMPAHAGEDKYTEIDAKALQTMMSENKDLVVIDSRGGKWYNGVLIDGAIHLAVTETTEESLSKVIATKDTSVVFYCTNAACPASAHAIMKAIDAGYTNLYKYKAGIEDWVEKGFQTVKDENYSPMAEKIEPAKESKKEIKEMIKK